MGEAADDRRTGERGVGLKTGISDRQSGIGTDPILMPVPGNAPIRLFPGRVFVVGRANEMSPFDPTRTFPVTFQTSLLELADAVLGRIR